MLLGKVFFAWFSWINNNNVPEHKLFFSFLVLYILYLYFFFPFYFGENFQRTKYQYLCLLLLFDFHEEILLAFPNWPMIRDKYSSRSLTTSFLCFLTFSYQERMKKFIEWITFQFLSRWLHDFILLWLIDTSN